MKRACKLWIVIYDKASLHYFVQKRKILTVELIDETLHNDFVASCKISMEIKTYSTSSGKIAINFETVAAVQVQH